MPSFSKSVIQPVSSQNILRFFKFSVYINKTVTKCSLSRFLQLKQKIAARQGYVEDVPATAESVQGSSDEEEAPLSKDTTEETVSRSSSRSRRVHTFIVN